MRIILLFLCLIRSTAPPVGWIRQRLWSSLQLCALQPTSGASPPPLPPIRLPRACVNSLTRSASSMKATWYISALRVSLASTSSTSDLNPPTVRPPLTFWSPSQTLMLVIFGEDSGIGHLKLRVILQGGFLKVTSPRSTNKTWIHIGEISSERAIWRKATHGK